MSLGIGLVILIFAGAILIGFMLCFLWSKFLFKTSISRRDEIGLPRTHELEPWVSKSTPTPSPTTITAVELEDDEEEQEYKQKTKDKMIEFRKIQKQLVERSGIAQLKPNCSLLICVDARPTQTGGYCINFVEKVCYWYTYKADQLPWDLNDKTKEGDPAEFEMKNLLFALLLWENEIRKFKDVEIFTDNAAIMDLKNKYGVRAVNFIKHLGQCEGVSMNSTGSMHISSTADPELFAKFIVPADDLSRWEIQKCEDFLSNIYKIYNFQSTNSFQVTRSVKSRPYHAPTHRSNEYLQEVKERLRWWTQNPCLKCGFMVEETSSLHNFQIMK